MEKQYHLIELHEYLVSRACSVLFYVGTSTLALSNIKRKLPYWLKGVVSGADLDDCVHMCGYKNVS